MKLQRQYIALLTSSALVIPTYSVTAVAGTKGEVATKSTNFKLLTTAVVRTADPDNCEIPAVPDAPIEIDEGCPVPTLQECQEELAPVLSRSNRCELVSRSEEGTCTALVEQAYGCESSDWGTESSVFSRTLTSTGLETEVAQLPLESETELAPYYVADIGSIQSRESALSFSEGLATDTAANWFDSDYHPVTPGATDLQYGGPTGGSAGGGHSAADSFYSNIYEHYRANGNHFASCFEYVYEQFYEVNEYWREVSHNRNNYRHAYNTAFAPYSVDSAIGTHHLDGSAFLNYGGDPIPMPPLADEKKNRFFKLPQSAGATRGLSGPSYSWLAPTGLRVAMAGYNSASQLILHKISENSALVRKEMGWHRAMNKALSVEGRPGPSLTLGGGDEDPADDDGPVLMFLDAETVDSDGADFSFDLDGNELPLPAVIQPSEAELAITGAVLMEHTNGRVVRRRFDAELNELDQLQDRKDALVREWNELAVKYPNSGWTVSELLSELPDEEEDGSPTYTAVISDGGGHPLPPINEYSSGSSEPPPPGFLDGVGDGLATAVVVLTAENAARKRVLDQLIEVYGEANAQGCLERGITPCDWSPRAFAIRGVSRFDEERQEAYEYCVGIMPYPFHENLGERRTYIDPPEGMDYPECKADVPDAPVPASLVYLETKKTDCLNELPAYYVALEEFWEEVATLKAEERLISSGLLDPSTGVIERPSKLDGKSESKGNKYFGLDYSYEYGFDTDVSNGLCDFEFAAGGDFSVTANVLSRSKSLIDTAAWIRTDEGYIDVHAEVLGIALFDGVNADIPEVAPLNLNFVTGGDQIQKDIELGSIRVWAGPVPLKIAGGISGKAGVELGFTGNLGTDDNACPTAHLDGSIKPRMAISGYVEAGVDLVVVAVGVRGELTLIDIGVNAQVDVDLSVSEPPEGSLADTDLLFAVNTSATVEMETLSGLIALFAKVGVCPFCKKGKKTLVSWDGLRWDKELFDTSYQVYLGDFLSVGGGQ